MHELGDILPTAPTKSNWVRRDDTLESIVYQATSHGQDITVHQPINVANKKRRVVVASSDGRWGENLSQETQETKGEANESRSTRQTRRSRIALFITSQNGGVERGSTRK